MNNPLKMGTMATKSTMKMAKDPAMKMAKDPAMNFNTKLKQASADGKLSGEFKEAVDNAPLNKAETPAKMAKDPAMKKAPTKKAPMKKAALKKDSELPADFDKMVKANSTNSAGGSINVGATKIATRKNGEFTPVYYKA